MWFFSSQNGEESGKLSGSIARFILRLIRIEESSNNLARAGHIVRKAAHFSLFALLGLSLGFAITPFNKPIHAFWGLSIAIISAILDEYHQTFVANRAGMWQDSLLDTCGAITGAAAAFVILLLINKHRKTE